MARALRPGPSWNCGPASTSRQRRRRDGWRVIASGQAVSHEPWKEAPRLLAAGANRSGRFAASAEASRRQDHPAARRHPGRRRVTRPALGSAEGRTTRGRSGKMAGPEGPAQVTEDRLNALRATAAGTTGRWDRTPIVSAVVVRVIMRPSRIHRKVSWLRPSKLRWLALPYRKFPNGRRVPLSLFSP